MKKQLVLNKREQDGKRVRIIKDDRVMNVKLENIFVKAV